jgi:hypothetical protein
MVPEKSPFFQGFSRPIGPTPEMGRTTRALPWAITYLEGPGAMAVEVIDRIVPPSTGKLLDVVCEMPAG